MLKGERCLPKGRLDTPNVVFRPVSLRNFLLTNRNTTPVRPHHSDIVDIVLIKVDLESREMSLWPLIQSPALNNLCRLLEFEILASDITTEELELSSLLGTFEELWSCSSECCDSLGVGEGLIELRGWGTEFLAVGDGGSVY